jgi:glycosyltransferase involved in cell wall biosynthesis
VKIFAAHDGGSGCAYYRMIMPLAELNRHDGFEVTFTSGLQTDRLGRPTGGVHASDMEGYDVIVGQRFNSHAGLRVWRGARTPYSRLVYETDDNVFQVSMENWAAFHLYQREEIRDAVAHCMEVSDAVTVTTPYLAEVMSEYNPNVKVLPNHIPGFVLDLSRKQRDRPCIGWCGGASHGRDVHLMIPSARRFLKRFPGWDLHLVGTDYRESVRKKKDSRVVFTPWTHITDDPPGYYSSLDFDIGLAPLLDTEFARSKSFIKILEYAAMGIPFLASDCEPYRLFTAHGENGFLVKYDHEWLGYMSELACDEKLRLKMGAAARESARAWTIEKGWTLWADAYRSLFPSRVPGA